MDWIWAHDMRLGDQVRFMNEDQTRTVTYVEPSRTNGRIYEPSIATRPIGFDGDGPVPVYKLRKVWLIHREPETP